MDGKVYRQRLTQTGILGAMVGLFCPMIVGVIFSNHFDNVAQNVMNGIPPPDLPVLIILALSVSTQVGWIFVLTGREYYQYINYPNVSKSSMDTSKYNPS